METALADCRPTVGRRVDGIVFVTIPCLATCIKAFSYVFSLVAAHTAATFPSSFVLTLVRYIYFMLLS